MKSHLIIVCACASTIQPALADTDITIRIAYRVIISPVDGSRPGGFSEQAVENAIAGMNALLASPGSGYRVDNVDAIRFIGSVGGFNRPNPSFYFASNVAANPPIQEDFQSDISNDTGLPSLYLYRSNCLNIYINDGSRVGSCMTPDGPILVMGGFTCASAQLQLHQIGHFLGLCNTQGCPCECECSPPSTSTLECYSAPVSDGIADTLPDMPCWDRDELSQHNFGRPFVQLAESDQDAVNNVFLNIMGFHNLSSCGQGTGATRLTELQLERWADRASLDRNAQCDGMMFFVQANFNGFQNGRSTNPFNQVSTAIRSADSGGDIIMIRTGTFPERLTIRSPVTLRVPRGHAARIGG